MQLTKEDIAEFSRMWQEEFGETLSAEVAREHAAAFLTFCLVLLGAPLTLESTKTPS